MAAHLDGGQQLQEDLRSLVRIAHDPENRAAVFREDHAQNDKLKRDDLSSNHRALVIFGPHHQGPLASHRDAG
jgi:hypothetical protein